ncbi:MAG: SDR family oxidoreductase [Paracoccaceae bacterium]|nr:SDR family oxidoreductase [Paracoccaceae bacterium]
MKILASKTALVTGASRGIGEATVRALDAAGARVVLTAQTVKDLERVAADLRNDPLVIPHGLAETGAGTHLAETVLSETGGVDVLVNNAGFAIRGKPEELTEADLDRIFAVNFRSQLMLTIGLGPAMIERGGGSIVNVSSVASLRGPVRRMAYAATKGAIDAMTRALAADWGPKGIRVNGVNPGIVKTAMLESRRKDMTGVEDALAARVALGRLGHPKNVADVIVFLASDAASYINGESITIDGGMTRVMTELKGIR